MNRYLLSSSALHDFSDNNFARRSSLASGLNLTNGKKRPKIEIQLKDQLPGFHVPSYTTRERIHGHVTITSLSDLTFDNIHISLQGTSRTWVEKIATAAPTNPRTRAFHTFLRLMQPIEEADIPEHHILRAERSYIIPFEFVIPERLLPQSCSHSRQNAQVEEEHLKLPPSLGDVMVSGDGKSLQSDFAPEMTTISYSVRVIVTRKSDGTQSRPLILGDNQLKLRIIPKTDELPPLEISSDPGEDYSVRRCKNIKKGLLMGKTKVGTLHVETSQPPPLRLPGVRHANMEHANSVMTMVTVRMRFDPAKADAKPPKLQMLWSRMKIATFFSTIPQKKLPHKSVAFTLDQNRGLMVDTLPLSSRNLGGQSWTKHVSERRDSAVAFACNDPPSSPEDETAESSALNSTAYDLALSPATTPNIEEALGGLFYTADVLVPVELPFQKFAFVPTFHSCLVSRVYALDMNIGVSAGHGNSYSVNLKVPVQITSVGSDNPISNEGMIPEGGFISARRERHDVFAPNMAAGSADLPGFEDAVFSSPRRASADPSVGFHGNVQENSCGDVDSDGEYSIQRPTWTSLASVRSSNRLDLAAGLDRASVDNDNTSPDAGPSGTASPTSHSVAARSSSLQNMQLTNDEILNTENYQSPDVAEHQFGNFHWEPVSFGRPGEGANPGVGESRRASEGMPPGYATVAAGTMLIGSGGVVRALS